MTPPPGFGSKWSWPWWEEAMASTSARPSPCPGPVTRGQMPVSLWLILGSAVVLACAGVWRLSRR